MKLIYWNTNNITQVDEIVDIIEYEKPDVLFLSETDKILLEEASAILESVNFEFYDNPGCQRINIIKNKNINLSLSLQERYFTSVIIEDVEITIFALHLPSQMYQHFDSLKDLLRDLRKKIDVEIGSSLEQRIIVIGDFNVNPYEKPMIDFDGFAATNTARSKTKVTNLGKTQSFYYNPTWQLYNDTSFPGTKYYQRPSSSAYDILEHHFLDQVIISMKMHEDSTTTKLRKIIKTDNNLFYSQERNKVLISDHLPLCYEIYF